MDDTKNDGRFAPMSLIEGLNLVVNFDEPTDFEEYAATLATELVDWMESDTGRCNAAAALWPNDLMRLSPWMQSIGGMFPPASMDWFQWIKANTSF